MVLPLHLGETPSEEWPGGGGVLLLHAQPKTPMGHEDAAYPLLRISCFYHSGDCPPNDSLTGRRLRGPLERLRRGTGARTFQGPFLGRADAA